MKEGERGRKEGWDNQEWSSGTTSGHSKSLLLDLWSFVVSKLDASMAFSPA